MFVEVSTYYYDIHGEMQLNFILFLSYLDNARFYVIENKRISGVKRGEVTKFQFEKNEVSTEERSQVMSNFRLSFSTKAPPRHGGKTWY